jgi:hypothetical protein
VLVGAAAEDVAFDVEAEVAAFDEEGGAEETGAEEPLLKTLQGVIQCFGKKLDLLDLTDGHV